MASKITVSSIRLGDIRPYGWEQYKAPDGKTTTIGHDFELEVTMKVEQYHSTGSRRWKSDDAESVITWPQKGTWNLAWDVDAMCREMPLLIWHEQIRFYDVDGAGVWNYVGEHNVDMFEHKPRAKTFGGFYPGIGMAGGNGWTDPWSTPLYNPGMLPLTTLDKPDKFDKAKLSEKAEMTTKLFRSKKKLLISKLTDRPGMTKDPAGGGIRGGGGLAPLAQGKSRARVLHFVLSFAGTGLGRVMATQILETQNGVTTICKFVKQRMSLHGSEHPENHRRWRAQHDPVDYSAVGNTNFNL